MLHSMMGFLDFVNCTVQSRNKHNVSVAVATGVQSRQVQKLYIKYASASP
jgi:hypothetical protein